MAKNEYGKWAFVIGVIAALVVGFAPAILGAWGIVFLVVLGLVVGWMNVDKAENALVLLAVLALPTALLAINALPTVGPLMGTFLTSLASMLYGVAAFVALKVIGTHLMD